MRVGGIKPHGPLALEMDGEPAQNFSKWDNHLQSQQFDPKSLQNINY